MDRPTTQHPLLLLFVLLLPIAGNAFGAANADKDAGVRIVSPSEGQQFAPGDKVSIVVEIAAPLYATDGGVTVAGMGLLRAAGFPGRRFTAKFAIPDAHAGPMKLGAFAFAGERVGNQLECRRKLSPDARAECEMLVAREVTIRVRPRTPPKQVIAQQHNYFPGLPPTTPQQLYVQGRYADGTERDLSSSATGTTYISSNPAVLAVDREGECNVIGPGLAVVTIENRGARDFVTFVVEDPAHPNPPIDLTNEVAIQRGSLQFEPNPRVVRSHYQKVTITNTTALPLPGPLFLAITGLPQRVIAYGGDGKGRHALNLPDTGLSLPPGKSVTVDLEFLNQGDAPIEYTARVYHGRPY